MRSIFRPRVLVPLAVVAIGVLAFALWWFTPWRLFVDSTVNEAAPVATAAQSATTDDTGAAASAPTGPTVVAKGSFISHEHATTGSAEIVELADGRRFLRFENLDTSNGPELVAALSDAPVIPGADGWRVFDDGRLVVLGNLKGNIGSQNYEIPADVDLTGLTSAVVWCDRFDVSFGAAELVPAL